MSLIDALTRLHDLQKVDIQIYACAQTLKKLDPGETLKQAAITVLKRHDVAAAELRAVETSLKDKDLALKSLEAKRKTVHDKLYSGKVSNPKELSDLEKDEKMLARQIGEQEETVLELMDRVERARQAEATQQTELVAAKTKWQHAVAHFQAETKRLQGEITSLTPVRERLAALVDKPLLRQYDDLRRQMDGVGLVVTGNDSCPACHVKLTAHTFHLLTQREEMVNCDNCGRIMFWVP